MARRRWTGILPGTLAVSWFAVHAFFAGWIGAQPTEDAGYARGDACAACHSQIQESYGRTGMARSFFRPLPANTVEDYTRNNTYYHKPSDSYFRMLERDGKYYQRRFQIDGEGKPVNVMEKQIDYVMGSGRHARAYLHRTARNTLIELPLGWYAEKGGYWAMNPGYDRPDHDGFRRKIGYDCIFCHDAYPEIPASGGEPLAEPVYTGALPEGIDCQRCHGPGRKHVQLAQTAGARVEEIRGAIVNPRRLSPERQMEICMQCHLETTSFPLPNSMQRYGRGPFAYRPGAPLSDYWLFFDHAAGKGREEKFELVNAVYRLRRSRCFQQSNGELRCTTCHNPHDIPRGEEAARHYDAACRKCHASAFDRMVASGQHTQQAGCAGCHMPERRTEDVVHATATDHYIQRRKPAGDLLAEMAERHETETSRYRGEVVPYYPETLPHIEENDLDVARAQVVDRSNLGDGIRQLTSAIERYSPKRAEYYLDLAEALRNSGEPVKALPLYREAARRNPESAVVLEKLGSALRRSRLYAEAAEVLRRAAAAAPENAPAWHELGLTYQAQGKAPEAVAALERALELDPEMAEAQSNLGILQAARGARAEAEAAFREAIRIRPDYADAHNNLANLLSGSGDFAQARRHFEIALRLRPGDAATRYNYAMALGRARQFDRAQAQLEESLRADPGLADAHALLADLLMAKGQAANALPHYREAVRLQPGSGRAQLGLGRALATTGDTAGALPHLRKAAADADAGVRDPAVEILRQLGKGQ